jgi:hypothetical protein
MTPVAGGGYPTRRDGDKTDRRNPVYPAALAPLIPESGLQGRAAD